MAPLAAKWGRLWRALLGQARIGREARGLPTSPCSPTVSHQHCCPQRSTKNCPPGREQG